MSSQILTTYRSCTWRCRSRQHNAQLCSAITKSPSIVTDEQLKIYFALTCANFARTRDTAGRTLVHWLADARDRIDLLEWLLDEIGADIDSKDSESGYTPLHRALLHGQLASAQVLIDRGARLDVFDHEGMTPLDIMRSDQAVGGFTLAGPTDVYSCGENVTSNLGHRVPTQRIIPDLVDYFSHRGISVKKVAMSKWHTAFLACDGAVYTCGRGSSGRLGHDDFNDRTLPTRVNVVPNTDKCVSVAVSDDHTVVVTHRGSAWAWGGNAHCQLGMNPAITSHSTPQMMSLGKNVKDHSFIGCVCGDNYTILWTNEFVYGCGANEGQFGPCALKSEPSLYPLRQIAAVAGPFSGADLLDIACGANAVAILTSSKRDVFLLQKFECRRIFGRDADFTRIVMNSTVQRKATDHSSNQPQPAATHHHHQDVVRLTLFSERGAVYNWDTKDRYLRRCLFTGAVPKMIYPQGGFAFGPDGLFLVTPNGQLYKGRIRQFSKIVVPSATAGYAAGATDTSTNREDCHHGAGAERSAASRKHSSAGGAAAATRPSTTKAAAVKEPSPYFAYRETGTFLDPAECQTIVLSPAIPNVHRAIAVTSTSADGRNFCVIQQNPKASLTELPPEIDSTLSEDYRLLWMEAEPDDCLHDIQLRTSDKYAQFRAAHKFILCSRCPYFSKRIKPSTTQLQIEEPSFVVTEAALDRILTFIYTDDCDLFHPGPITGRSALVSFNDDNLAGVDDGRLEKPIKTRDPVRELTEAAKRLNIKILAKRLESVRWDAATNTVRVQHRYACHGFQALQYDRNAFPELCDVVLHCKDAVQLSAHRCVLAARSEYFRCMFATGWWSETRRHQTLNVDFDWSVMEPVVHYLYKDHLPPQPPPADESGRTVKKNKEYAVADKDALEYYGRILVCADQWLLDRLRRLCEMELSARITLRNVADMLEFSYTINASKLFDSCSQFIALNLPSLLEANALRNSTPECLRRVGACYRELYPHVGHRALTPSSEPPTVEDIHAVWNYVLASGLSPDDILQEYSTSYTTQAQAQAIGDSPTASGGGGGSAKKKRPAARTTPRARRTSASTTNDTTSALLNASIEASPEMPASSRSIQQTNYNTDSKSRHIITASVVVPPAETHEQKHAWKRFNDEDATSPISTPMATKMMVSGVKMESSKPIPTPAATSRPRNRPWNVAVSPIENAPEISLRDLMAAEEKKEVAAVSERRKSSEVNAAYFATSPPKSSSTAWASVSPPSFVGSSSSISIKVPHSSSVVLQPRPSHQTDGTLERTTTIGKENRTFSEIVNEERSKVAARTRVVNKPLKFVQAEEMAMQELALLYQIDDNWDEFITVERAPAVIAEPTWQAHLGSPPRT